MDEQEQTDRQARIETAREGLRSALVGWAKARKGAHGLTSAAGRGTPAGQTTEAGQ